MTTPAALTCTQVAAITGISAMSVRKAGHAGGLGIAAEAEAIVPIVIGTRQAWPRLPFVEIFGAEAVEAALSA